MILTGCQTGQIDEPQLVEHSELPYLEAEDNGEIAVEPEQPTTPQAPVQVDEAHLLVPVEETIYMPVYMPPEVPPATLEEAFAAVVYRTAYIEHELFLYGFSLMDINLDGEPALLLHIWSINGFAGFTVFSKDTSLEFINIASGAAAIDFIYQNFVEGSGPMRFYQNDDTGEVIFSTRNVGFGGAEVHWLTYTNNRTFDVHRRIVCWQSGGRLDQHGLWYASEWHQARENAAPPIAEFIFDDYTHDVSDARMDEWSEELGVYWLDQFGLCGVGLERDSHSPSIVQLVNMALEGFTEITVPERHEFHGTHRHFFFDYVEEIQDWLFSVMLQVT